MMEEQTQIIQTGTLHDQADKMRAVLFADIVGSSRFYQELGNTQGQRKVDALLSLMIHLIQSHGGRLVKTIGDEIMVIFDEVESAAEAAIAINLKVQDQGESIRTGMAYGSLIFDRFDAFGNTVNRAASLVSAANTKQILMDQSLFDEMPYWLVNCCDLYDRLKLKGGEDKALVYRLDWQSESDADLTQTQVSGAVNAAKNQTPRQLELTVAGATLTLEPSDLSLSFGRDPALVEHVVADSKVSRQHGHIAFNRGKFIYTDHSTNGSFVQEENQPQLYLRRESIPLIQRGSISLGQPSHDAANIIFYRLKN